MSLNRLSLDQKHSGDLDCSPGTTYCAQTYDPDTWRVAAQEIGPEGCVAAGECYFALLALCKRAQVTTDEQVLQTVQHYFPDTTPAANHPKFGSTELVFK